MCVTSSSKQQAWIICASCSRVGPRGSKCEEESSPTVCFSHPTIATLLGECDTRWLPQLHILLVQYSTYSSVCCFSIMQVSFEGATPENKKAHGKHQSIRPGGASVERIQGYLQSNRTVRARVVVATQRPRVTGKEKGPLLGILLSKNESVAFHGVQRHT